MDHNLNFSLSENPKKDLNMLFLKDFTVEEKSNNLELKPTLDNQIKKKKKPRCPECQAKLSLIDQGKKCRCERMFCSEHFYPEAHQCNFDFKKEGRKELELKNPGLKVSKVKGL